VRRVIIFEGVSPQMPRIARIVVPDYPHHIIQKGNRGQRVFFSDLDKDIYIKLLHKYSKKAGIAYWAYCLMDNHVHLVAVPKTEDSLRRGIGEAHRNYTNLINSRENWRGYLWQGRFLSYPMDEKHLLAAVRYIEMNPIRAGLVKRAEDYHYSSAGAHVSKAKDPLLSENYLLSEIADWAIYLTQPENESEVQSFIRHARTGRPLGDELFLAQLEKITGRILRKRKPGPKLPRHSRIP
jgi:putative transposase